MVVGKYIRGEAVVSYRGLLTPLASAALFAVALAKIVTCLLQLVARYDDLGDWPINHEPIVS